MIVAAVTAAAAAVTRRLMCRSECVTVIRVESESQVAPPAQRTRTPTQSTAAEGDIHVMCRGGGMLAAVGIGGAGVPPDGVRCAGVQWLQVERETVGVVMSTSSVACCQLQTL